MKHALRIAGIGLLASAAVTLAAVPATARGGFGGMDGGPRGPLVADFATLDVDGNGQITEEDLLAGHAARIAEADTDGSGTLSADEIAAQIVARAEANAAPWAERVADRADQMAARMIEARDTDGDGVLSADEFGPEKGFGRLIDRFDTDDDNAISQAEYDEAKAEMAQHRGRGPGGHGGPRGHGGMQGQGGPVWR